MGAYEVDVDSNPKKKSGGGDQREGPRGTEFQFFGQRFTMDRQAASLLEER